ncbi:MAG TPA: SDR family NAD(P)-dependent oxidoreductase [Cyclobacteriaceae bacterium]|jgi:short-subunit dehydrogenase|nr:SDR family NAD(P)-dependent oxidoreductase [Cytophagales bacterium]HRE66356.1 SDR family NAD(P)-dependent oxidoreductase [Cyclobacteriaceae bacterium]HRF32822.1 SDR family NAD(P)-dependent oxidoreductase [Cyclobacteriaceae bacterium]
MIEYAVITGASSGLGKAFAFELAKRKINVVLISLPHEGLPEMATQLMKYSIEVAWYETDLTVHENVRLVTDWINDHFSVSLLINNAGMGGTKRFIEADTDYINRIIQLNVMSTSLITRALVHNLMRQPRAYILNVASMAAFSPMGFKTVYPASKAFIHHFTRGLYQELRDTNVFVSVVNPGPMKTNHDATTRINRQGLFGRLGLLSPEKVAAISIRQLFKRDTMIMLGWGNGISWLLMKVLPIWVRLPLLTKAIEREIKMERCTR